MHKLTITIDGSDAPQEAMEEAMHAVAQIGAEGAQKLTIALTATDDEADDLQDHLTAVLSRLDSSLTITVKAQTERQIVGRSIPGITPIERSIDRTRSA